MMPDPLAVFLGACFLVIGFIILLYALRLIQHAQKVLQISRYTLDIMGDVTLDDDAKEKIMQKKSIELFKLFVILTIGGATAVFLPALIIWQAGEFGWLSFNDVIEFTLSWEFLLGTTIAGISFMLVFSKKKPDPESEFANQYSGIDRLLHQVAFASRPVQVMLSNLEDRVFDKKLTIRSSHPVFITGLPRAGTTLLLELFNKLPEFSTHSYRQMPFVLIPLFWDRFAKNFRTSDVPRERAHGDGMKVSLDSPEAFEEIIWMQFWSDHYKRDFITPWEDESAPEFNTFFDRHRKKITWLARKSPDKKPERYLSKNNLNIARIGQLISQIPDCRIILPFRDPYQHAASLLRQHQNFTRIQEKDPFARRYMAGIGHFDFGLNLKPVNFDNWLETNNFKDSTDLSFWLSYWESTYRHLLQYTSSDQVCFSDFDAFCENPLPALKQLADFAGVKDDQCLLLQSERVHPLHRHKIDIDSIDIELRNRIDLLYKQLKAVSL